MTCEDCVYCSNDPCEKYGWCHFEKISCWDIAPCEHEREKEQVNDEYAKRKGETNERE